MALLTILLKKNIEANVDQCGKYMHTQGYHCNVYVISTHENLEVDFHKMLNVHDEMSTFLACSFLSKIKTPYDSYYLSNLEQKIIA